MPPWPRIASASGEKPTFIAFCDRKKAEPFEQICCDENLDPDRFGTLSAACPFSSRPSPRDDAADAPFAPPSILERRKITDRILSETSEFVETFDENVEDLEVA